MASPLLSHTLEPSTTDRRLQPWTRSEVTTRTQSNAGGLTRNEAALLGAIIGYGILVVVVTPLLLGFLPLLAVGWMLRVPVASAPADIATADINAVAPTTSVTTATEAVASPAATERRTAIAVEAS